MRLLSAKHLKKIGLLVATMFVNTVAEAQVRNFEYKHGANVTSYAENLKVLKDNSILTISNWDFVSSGTYQQSACINKLSSSGKQLWKKVMLCDDSTHLTSTLPVCIEELSDSSILFLVDNLYFPDTGGFITNYSSELIKFDKSGAKIKSVGFTSNPWIGHSGAAMVALNDNVYVASVNGQINETLIQKFDKNLNRLTSVSIGGLYCRKAIIHKDNLLIVGERDTVVGPGMLTLDTNLNILSANQFRINDSVDKVYSSVENIVIDMGNPVILGYYFIPDSTGSGIEQKYFIYPDDLSSSKLVSSEDCYDMTINNGSLYMVGTKSWSAYIAKYNPNTGLNLWTSVYSSAILDDLQKVTVVNNSVYSLGNSSDITIKGDTVVDDYLIQADTIGDNVCSKSKMVLDRTFKNIAIDKYDFYYVEGNNYISSPNVLKEYTSLTHYESLSCIFPSPTNIQHLSSTTDIEVYPTITSGIVHLDHVDALKGSSYQLVNINGQLMMNGKLKNANNNLDISNLSDGFYLLRVLDEKSKAYSTFKIVKQSN
jgi:hypothetical protein